MQVASARVIAEAIPRLHDRFGARARKPFECREPFQKPRIELRDSAHLRLLQHELGDDDAVRIAGAAPRKVARMLSIPPKQLAHKGLSGLGRHRYITYTIPSPPPPPPPRSPPSSSRFAASPAGPIGLRDT